MGTAKQLLPLGGKSMIRWVAEAACRSNVDETVVVTGAGGAAVAKTIADLPVRIIDNTLWQEGQASSLRAGVEAIGPEAAAALFLLGDQPLVTTAVIDWLISAYARTEKSIVVPVYEGRRGNPVLFDLECWWTHLLMLTGDTGGRRLIESNPDQVLEVTLTRDIFQDADTPEDYRQLQKLWK